MKPSELRIREIHDYLVAHFCPLPWAIPHALAHSQESGLPQIHLHHPTARLLTLLVSLHKPKRLFEIGTLGGVSALWMASAMAPDATILTIERDKHHAKVAKENFEYANEKRIEICLGDAAEIIPDLQESFDFFFFDGDRRKYLDYLDHLIALAKPGALIVIDNVLRNGKVLDPKDPDMEVLSKIHTYLCTHPNLDTTIIPTFGGHKGGMLDGIAVSKVIKRSL